MVEDTKERSRLHEESTGRYRILMSIKPAVILGRRWSFKRNWYEIIFEEIVHPQVPVPTGLWIWVTVSSMPDIETAQSRAKGLVNLHLALFSFLAATGLPEAVILRAYDVTPGRTHGVFVQHHYQYESRLLTMSVRNVRESDLKAAQECLVRLSEENNDTLLRAMHWYRRAALSGDVLERFTLLWIGLESVNPLLRADYGLEMEYSQCPKCKHTLSPLSNGVKKLWEEFAPEVEWARVRRLRAQLIHGGAALKNVVSEAKTLVPILDRVMREGLARLLGIPARIDMKSTSFESFQQVWYSSEASIEGPNLEDLDKTVLPEFKLVNEIPEPGSHARKLSPTFTPVIDSRFSFSNLEHTLHLRPEVARRVVDETSSED